MSDLDGKEVGGEDKERRLDRRLAEEDDPNRRASLSLLAVVRINSSSTPEGFQSASMSISKVYCRMHEQRNRS